MPFNTLRYGEANEVADWLGGYEADEGEIRAALCNALNRIQELERRVASLTAAANRLTP